MDYECGNAPDSCSIEIYRYVCLSSCHRNGVVWGSYLHLNTGVTWCERWSQPLSHCFSNFAGHNFFSAHIPADICTTHLCFYNTDFAVLCYYRTIFRNSSTSSLFFLPHSGLVPSVYDLHPHSKMASSLSSQKANIKSGHCGRFVASHRAFFFFLLLCSSLSNC